MKIAKGALICTKETKK